MWPWHAGARGVGAMFPALLPPSTLWLAISKGCRRRVRTQRHGSSLQREQLKRTLNPSTARPWHQDAKLCHPCRESATLIFSFQPIGLSWQDFQGGSLASGTKWTPCGRAVRTSYLTRENAGTRSDYLHLKGNSHVERATISSNLAAATFWLVLRSRRDET